MNKTAKPKVEVIIGADVWLRYPNIVETLSGVAAEIVDSERPGSGLTVLLDDDDTVCELNGRYGGENKATDVLSFEGEDDYLGDIIVAHGYTASTVSDVRNFQRRVVRLVIHGTLHLLGYDHGDRSSAKVMNEAEERWLGRLGWAQNSTT